MKQAPCPVRLNFSIHAAAHRNAWQIPTDKIREVIGSGGRSSRENREVSGAQGEYHDDGYQSRSPRPTWGEAIRKPMTMIWSIVAEGRKKGKGANKGTVVKLVDFGAFVNFSGSVTVWCHVSQKSRTAAEPSVGCAQGKVRKSWGSNCWLLTIAARSVWR